MRRQSFFYYRRHISRRVFFKAAGAILGCLLLWAALHAIVQLRPLLEQLATTRVSNAVNRIVTEAVDEAVKSGEIRYDQLIRFEKDQEGKITAISSDFAAFNRLQSEILDRVLSRVDDIPARELAIPIGNLTGSALLAGRGPRIRVRMESVGSSSAYFENEFTSAGINQTRHQIILHVDVYVGILLPGFTTATKVSHAVTVAETVIVGSVPDTYTYFASEPDTYQENAKDYLLNHT